MCGTSCPGFSSIRAHAGERLKAAP
jgi:hypothetical protein